MHSSSPISEICSMETAERVLEEKERTPTIISGQIVIYPEDPFAIPPVDPCFES
ncbi:hypothetical protein O179_02650 [Chlamydia trachomatis]|uniref:hypothetical protein n=1 Tax=Chlamydia trachomatis TaxID=813 RepID=UPI00038DBF22|nr:hypothetical protein [Chlamydia trachomatis]AGT72285.1 hypothetical protein O179_02650 [Chlamydia trachomatis]